MRCYVVKSYEQGVFFFSDLDTAKPPLSLRRDCMFKARKSCGGGKTCGDGNLPASRAQKSWRGKIDPQKSRIRQLTSRKLRDRQLTSQQLRIRQVDLQKLRGRQLTLQKFRMRQRTGDERAEVEHERGHVVHGAEAQRFCSQFLRRCLQII